MNFKEFKTEILKRAKASGACSGEYSRAENANDFKDLIKVLTDNFNYACQNKTINIELLEKVGAKICNENDLFFNCDTSTGYLLASDSATVRASGSATVEASGSATVRAFDSATVKAFDSATVRAFDSATVRASNSAYICSYSTVEHKVSNKAILRYYYENKVVLSDINSLKS